MNRPYLEFSAITKQFPGVVALKEVTFGIREGSVHGLLGENGAGKSTLLKILSGVYAPTSGSLSMDGAGRDFRTTREAIEAGVAVIYQELNLVPDMSVEENLLLGHMPATAGVIDRRAMRKAARTALIRMAEEIEPSAKMRRLSIGQRQLVEICKALMRNAKVIAFDEPTSSLSEREVKRLFSVIRDLKAEGRVVIYVSHRLEEVFEICDEVTVFRDGSLVAHFDDMAELTRDILVSRMVGREILDIYDYTPRPPGPAVLVVRDLQGPGLEGPASFTLHAGEILGFFGLIGAGRTELMKLLCGAVRPTSGEVILDGKRVRARLVGQAIRAGLALCPEDRKYEGIIPVRDVGENINISVRRLFSYLGFVVDSRRENENAKSFVAKLGIKTPSLRQLVMNLSGGNQQKTILARWLSEKIKVLLMDEPTRGIDVGAKNEIYHIMYDLAGQGMGVVMVSSELPEILGVADRIIVMREGRIVGELARGEADEESVLTLALPASASA